MRKPLLLVAVIGALIALPAPHAGGACSLTPTGGLVTRSLGSRSYELYVPSGLDDGAPLVLSLHGLFGDGRQHADATGWMPFSDDNGLIVAFPNGNLRSWYFAEGSSDVAFLRSVVVDISATWCVDSTHVHVTGHSNGAYMAQRVGCDAPDVFASATEYAGGSPDNLFSGCSPGRGVGVGLFHGDADRVVSPSQGMTARDRWVARNECAPIPTTEPVADGTFLRYTGCRDGVEVWWRLYAGQGHSWPTGARQQDMLSTMWAFFQAHPAPP